MRTTYIEKTPWPLGGAMAESMEFEVNRKSSAYARWIQSSLNNLMGAGLSVDGDIGPLTRAAVRKFQERDGNLSVDGAVGPLTEAAMIRWGASPPPGYNGSAGPAPSPTPSPAPPSGTTGFNSARFRSEMQRIALQELQRWRSAGVSESNPSVKNTLLNYWAVVPKGTSFTAVANWWYVHSWSAAFISWVVKNAGGGSLFKYSATHTTYAYAAKMNRGTSNPFKLYRPHEKRLQIGDIVIRNYNGSHNFDNLQSGVSGTHGDVVVNISGSKVSVVGGNVGDKVSERTDVSVNSSGFVNSSQIWAVLSVDDITSGPSTETLDGAGTAPSGNPSGTASACSTVIQVPSDWKSKIRVHSRGFAAYGGGRIDQILPALVRCGKISVTASDIDMMQRIANVESAGLINAVNSWDSAYMSFGFMQLTLKYEKLAILIQRSAVHFRKYNISLSGAVYPGVSGNIKQIQGTTKPDDLRLRAWAEAFFAAGYDVDILAEQVKYCLEIVANVHGSLLRLLGSNASYYSLFYNQSARLRALVQETHNNRPAYLKSALTNAVTEARSKGVSTITDFLTVLERHIRERYRINAARENTSEQKMIDKANRLITKTANP